MQITFTWGAQEPMTVGRFNNFDVFITFQSTILSQEFNNGIINPVCDNLLGLG